MSENEYIRRLTEQLEDHCQAGPISNWTDINFVKLSEEISSSTHILISKNTLKRLLGKIKVANDYKPQRETKNALAMYLGYKNWDDFCIRNKPEGEVYVSVESSSFKPKSKETTFWYAAGGVVGLVVLFLFFWLYPHEEQKVVPEQFTYSIKNPIDTVPYTLVINYDVSKLNTDSAILNLDGPIFLSPENRTITSNIVLPTYRWITLKKGKKTLKSLPIHCLSRGWQMYYSENLHRLFPVSENEKLGNGKAGFNPTFFNQHPETDSGKLFMELRNTKNFPASGDHFTLEIILFPATPSGNCLGTTFRVFGEHGHNELRLYPKGCRQHNFIVLGEKVILGRYEDLTQIPFENGQWNVLRIEVSDKNYQLKINDKLAFRDSYKDPIGQIKGIFIQGEGHSQIESIKLWDEKGKLVENEEF